MRTLALVLGTALCLELAAPITVAAQSSQDGVAAQVAKPLDTDAAYAQALSELRAGNFDSAAAQFDALLLHDPDDVDWLLGRAQALMALGRAAQALPSLERARSLAPAYEDVWRVELAALETTGQITRAADLLEEAVVQFPGSEWPVARRVSLRERELLRAGTRISLSSSYEHLSDDKGEWRTLALDVDQPFSPRLRALIGAHAEERFGERDEQLAAALVTRFDGGWVAVASGDVAPGATILPLSSLQLEVIAPVARNANVGLRARHAHHQTVDVDSLAATGEVGSGNYRFAYSLTATRPSDLDPGFSHTVRLSRDYGTGSNVSLVLAEGDEAETIAPGRVLVTRTRAIALVGVHWRSAAWGFGWELGYHEQGDLYNRIRVRLGLEHRF